MLLLDLPITHCSVPPGAPVSAAMSAAGAVAGGGAAAPTKGDRLQVLSNATVRSGPKRSRKEVGMLLAGEVITVMDQREVDGVVCVRVCNAIAGQWHADTASPLHPALTLAGVSTAADV